MPDITKPLITAGHTDGGGYIETAISDKVDDLTPGQMKKLQEAVDLISSRLKDPKWYPKQWETLPKLPMRQRVYSWLCKKLDGDKYEENIALAKEAGRKMNPLRVRAYWFFSRRRFRLGNRLAKKHNTHVFR